MKAIVAIIRGYNGELILPGGWLKTRRAEAALDKDTLSPKRSQIWARMKAN